jgi:hypothetical protein
VARLVDHLDLARVRANLAAIEERVGAACARAGRDPARVEILAATKYVPVDLMAVLAEAGVRLVGENTAQALQEKHGRWGDSFTFDFIGHLQSRKARLVLPLVRLIHSVDGVSVLEQIERHAEETTGVLLQVNVAGEESKFGVSPDDADAFVEAAQGLERVRFAGLMTMPPFTAEPERARAHFAALRELATRLQATWAPRHDFSVLSMGTSQDFEVAVEEGATIIRVGEVLYR